jgi:hypothetical protein
MRATFHEDFAVEGPVRRGSDRGFGFLLGGVGAALALWPLLRGGTPRIPLLGASVALVVVAAVFPRVLALPHRMWLRLGDLLRAVTTPIVLFVIFYAVLTPLGLVRRLWRGPAIPMRPDRSAPTYWTARPPQDDASASMRRPF